MGTEFIGSTSGNGGCPSLFRTARGTLVVQGTTVTDEDTLAAMRTQGNGIPPYESAVEVPAELLRFVDIEALPLAPFGDDDRPRFVVDNRDVPAVPVTR